jgi:hypothetical protein
MGTSSLNTPNTLNSLKVDNDIVSTGHGQRRRERIAVLDRRRARLLEAVLAESVRLGEQQQQQQQQTPIGARRAETTGGVGVPPRRRPRRGEHAAPRPASVRSSSASWSAARRA